MSDTTELTNAIAALKTAIKKGNQGFYEAGVQYTIIAAHKDWKGMPYDSAAAVFKETEAELPAGTLRRYARVATAFTEEVATKYYMTNLAYLLEYANKAHLGQLPPDPGDLLIPVETATGVVQKAFKTMTTAELRGASMHASSKAAPTGDDATLVADTNDGLSHLTGHKHSHMTMLGHGDSATFTIAGLTREEANTLKALLQGH